MILGTIRCLLETLAAWEFEAMAGGSVGPFRRAYLRWMRIHHGDNIMCGKNIYIRNRGNLVLGHRCAIGSFTRIWNYAPIHIGDDFLSAGGLTINSATHDPVTLNPVGRLIHIGDRVWCGLNVTILAGVTIGNDVVIGAGSVVTADIESNSIAVGVPARKIKNLGRDEKTKMWKWANPTIINSNDFANP